MNPPGTPHHQGTAAPAPTQDNSSPAVDIVHHAAEVATAAAAASPLMGGRELSQEEFLSLYQQTMKAKFEEAKRQQQQSPPRYIPDPGQLPPAPPAVAAGGAGGVPAINGQPALNYEQIRQQQLEKNKTRNALFAKFCNFVWMLAKIGMVCAVFTQGDRKNFMIMFAVLLAMKFFGWVSQSINIDFIGARRQTNAAAAAAPAAPRVKRSKVYKVGYVALKTVTTFAVSLFPSWRVEALEEELKREGVLNFGGNEEEQQPQQHQAAAPVPAPPAAPQEQAPPAEHPHQD